MKTKIILLVIIITLTSILGFNSCKKGDSPTGPTESTFLMPLKVGNKWMYQMKTIDSLKNEKTKMDSIYIWGDTLLNGDTWYFILHSDPWLNRDDGLYSMGMDSSGKPIPILSIKYPVNIGDKWTTGPEEEKMNFTLLSKGESVTVTAGTFSCYNYQTESVYKDPNGSYSYYTKSFYWICPGKGIIKVEQWYRHNNGVLFLEHSEELLSYILK